ncbi:MAG: hypothetical protein GY754_33160 [bacterium]|nr:hypothetical protein [bacterium]
MKNLISLHIIYLCLLPMAGAFAVLPIDYGSYTLRFGGWITGVVFLVVLLTQYQVPARKFKALLIIGLVPAELVLHVLYFGESVGMYFLEASFIELFCLIIALTITMLIYKPTGYFGIFVGLCLSAIVILGYGEPLYRVYVTEQYHYMWWVFLIGVLLSGTWAHLQIVLPHAQSWPDSRQIKLPAFLFRDDEIYIDSPFVDRDPTVSILLYILFWLIFFMTPFSSIFIEAPPGY